MFRTDQVTALNEPLSKKRVSKRQGLSYIEGWFAIQEANRIFGYGNWGKEVTSLDCVGATEEEVKKNGRVSTRFRVAYIATVRLTVRNEFGEETILEDVGYGDSISYNGMIENHENAAKEAVTDALKRCFKDFGNKFGLALYDKKQENVESEKKVQKQRKANLLTPEQKSKIKELRADIDKETVKQIYRDNGALGGDMDNFDVEGLIADLTDAAAHK